MPEDPTVRQMQRLQEQFEAVFMTALAPKDAALFTNRQHIGRDNHVYYFSPKATQIFSVMLSAWSPTECDAPAKDSAALLVGHADAWDMLA